MVAIWSTVRVGKIWRGSSLKLSLMIFLPIPNRQTRTGLSIRGRCPPTIWAITSDSPNKRRWNPTRWTTRSSTSTLTSLSSRIAAQSGISLKRYLYQLCLPIAKSCSGSPNSRKRKWESLCPSVTFIATHSSSLRRKRNRKLLNRSLTKLQREFISDAPTKRVLKMLRLRTICIHITR